MTTEARIIKARSSLILGSPFFGCLVMKLKVEEDKSISTAAVNGKTLFYNPDFIASLNDIELKGVLCHEVMHCALGHHWRMDDRDNRIWNIAADYAINNILVDANITLPKGALIDSQLSELATENIYNNLINEANQQDKEKGNDDTNDQRQGENDTQETNNKNTDPGNCGGVKPCNDTEDDEEQKAEWKAILSQASKMGGSIPNSLKRLIDGTLNPELPWFVLLRDFVEMTAKNDYNWTHANRRYINRNLCLPSLRSEELPAIVIAIDTSGSIDKTALAKFAAEVSSIMEAYDTTITILYCDTSVKKEETVTQADLPLKMVPVGGGGTAFEPVFSYVEEKGLTPACLLYFTDLWGRFPNTAPDYPVMWITTAEGRSAPFGEAVKFNS